VPIYYYGLINTCAMPDRWRKSGKRCQSNG
jgi:hypothetical protein